MYQFDFNVKNKILKENLNSTHTVYDSSWVNVLEKIKTKQPMNKFETSPMAQGGEKKRIKQLQVYDHFHTFMNIIAKNRTNY